MSMINNSNKKNYILSIYFGYHDSCLTISENEVICLHLEAERYFRKKHSRLSKRKMIKLIKVGLDHLGLTVNDIETLVIAAWNNQFRQNKVTLLGKTFKPMISSHHRNHIGTCMPSGFREALAVCADGGSEDGTTKIYSIANGETCLLEDLNDKVVTGKFYGTITQMIIEPRFMKAHTESPGKTMGLSALGSYSQELYDLLKEYSDEVNDLQKYGCNYLRKIFGLDKSYDNVWQDKRRKDLAYTAQYLWQETFVEEIAKYKDKFENLMLSGGCFLNILLNTRLLESSLFKSIYVSPVSGDGGQSLGAILYHFPHIKCDYPFLGRGFGDVNADNKQLVNQVVSDLLEHKIIAWYQGRSEAGARSLGHRSFLALPDSLQIKKRLSEEVKKREPYRPVAGMLPEEDLTKFFDTVHPSPFMTFAPRVKPGMANRIPAIVHADGTSRIQTLAQKDNPVLHEILKRVGQATGTSVLMNTSFNVAGEPIVDTPEDAKRSFDASEADILYINGEQYKQ